MAATRFTEGSWRVEWGQDKDGDPYFDILKSDADAGDDGRMVDASYSIVEMAYPVIQDEDEARANANLIAAAPDLYGALDALRGAIADLKASHDIGWWPRLDDACLRAARALADANGVDWRVGEDDI